MYGKYVGTNMNNNIYTQIKGESQRFKRNELQPTQYARSRLNIVFYTNYF